MFPLELSRLQFVSCDGYGILCLPWLLVVCCHGYGIFRLPWLPGVEDDVDPVLVDLHDEPEVWQQGALYHGIAE